MKPVRVPRWLEAPNTVAARGYVTLVVLIVTAITQTRSLTAQEIRGQLINASTNASIRGAFIVLLDADSVEVRRVLTDNGGRFTIIAPAPGRFRLQSQIVGVQSSISPPIDVEWGKTVDFRFEIPGLQIVLPEVVVEGQRTCRVLPEGGLPTAILWG